MKKTVLGVDISLVTPKTVMSTIEDLLAQKKQIQIVTPNPEQVMQAQVDEQFRQVLNNAAIAIPDGVGLVWGIRSIQHSGFRIQEVTDQQTKRKIERVTGVDLMVRLCTWAAKKMWRVGLLGAREEVGETAVAKLKTQNSKLKIIYVGSHGDVSIFDKQQNEQLLHKINQQKIHILFVAYGAPFQEKWIAKHLSQMPTVKIAMGVGGAFDVISGKLKRPPVWIQKIGMEWLFRLIQEPWRWKRQLRLVEFVWKVMWK